MSPVFARLRRGRRARCAGRLRPRPHVVPIFPRDHARRVDGRTARVWYREHSPRPHAASSAPARVAHRVRRRQRRRALSLQPLVGARAERFSLRTACDNATAHVTFPLTMRARTRPVQSAHPPVVADRTLTLAEWLRSLHGQRCRSRSLRLSRRGPTPAQTPDAYADTVQARPVGLRVHVHAVRRRATDQRRGQCPTSGIADGRSSPKAPAGQPHQGRRQIDLRAIVLADDDQFAGVFVAVGRCSSSGYTSGDIVQDGSESDATVVLGFLITTILRLDRMLSGFAGRSRTRAVSTSTPAIRCTCPRRRAQTRTID